MQTVGIVGGSGFIGTSLAFELNSLGFKVMIIDAKNPSSSLPYINCDITDYQSVEAATHGLDGLFHLAAIVGVDRCLHNYEKLKEVNVSGSKNIIKACKINNIKNILFTSSSEVYGDCNGEPFKENDPLYPKSHYGKMKKEIEEILKSYASSDFQVSIVRLFNVYGKNQSNEFVINRFFEQALTKREITVYGDGNQKRCFTYISDAVQGLIKAFLYKKNNYGVFNIGNDQPTSILQLAETIIELTGQGTDIRFINYGDEGIRNNSVEIFNRIPNINKAKEKLAFHSKVSLETGLKLILERTTHEVNN